MFVIVAMLYVKCCGCDNDSIVCKSAVFVIMAMLYVMCCVCDSSNNGDGFWVMYCIHHYCNGVVLVSLNSTTRRTSWKRSVQLQS